jgi:hypothetical protein
MKTILWVSLPILFLLAACGGGAEESQPSSTASPVPTELPSPTEVPSPAPEPTAPPEPTSTPAPIATPTFSVGNVILPTVAVPTPTPNTGNRFARALDGAAIQMNSVRELSSTTKINREFLSTAELKDLMLGLFEESKDEINDDQLLYVALGLMDADESLYDILLALNSEGILGFFEPDEKKLYVVQDTDKFTPADERTYVHEYVHHLQEANFNIKAKLDSTETNYDASRALRAILEGDATIAEFIYLNQQMEPEEQEAADPPASEALNEALDAAPYIAIRTFVFPYIEGVDFAVQLYQGAGWVALNEALQNPPASTEQVLHVQKYISGEPPVEVEMPELLWILGDGWEHVRTDNLGELFLRGWLEADFSPQQAAIASTGWGGDAYSLFKGPDDENVLVLSIVWDSDRDAEEFFETVQANTEARTGVPWEDSPIAVNARSVSLPDRHIYIEQDVLVTLMIFTPNADFVETMRQAMALAVELGS